MSKNCTRLKSNFLFFALILLFHTTFSLKSFAPQTISLQNNQQKKNLKEKNHISEFQQKAHENEVVFLNLLMNKITQKRSEVKTQKEQQKKMQQQQQKSSQLISQQAFSEAKNEINEYYINYENIRKEISNDYDNHFGFCKETIFSVSDQCNKKEENTLHKIAFHNISEQIFNSSKNIFQKYKNDIDEMQGASDKFKKYFNFLEEDNSIEVLLSVLGDLYSSYPNLEDKYNTTKGIPNNNTNEELEKQLNSLQDENLKEFENVLQKLSKENYLGEKFTAALVEKNLPEFKKDAHVKQLLNEIKKDKSKEEFLLDREAKGQMLFDKISWYLDYNTKNEEDMLQRIEMLKLRLDDADLKIQKESLELDELINIKKGVAELKSKDLNTTLADFYSCQGVKEVQDKCDEAEKIYKEMISSLELENKYLDKMTKLVHKQQQKQQQKVQQTKTD